MRNDAGQWRESSRTAEYVGSDQFHALHLHHNARALVDGTERVGEWSGVGRSICG